jgi:hypothetical protein
VVKSVGPSGPVRVSTRLRVKDQNDDENSESSDSSEEIESGEEMEKSGESEKVEIEDEDRIEDEGEGEDDEDDEDEDEDEGEGEGEDEGEGEGEDEIVVENAVGPVGPAGPIFAGPVGSAGPVLAGPAHSVFAGPVGPVSSTLGTTIGSTGAATSFVPAITVLPATPVKNKGKNEVTPDDNQDMLQDYPPDLDPASLMGDPNQYKLKRGRERSGTGDARGIKTHRRSASHSTAPTVPSTEDDDMDEDLDEIDPQGSSRTTGGFSRGKAMGNNYNWGDADDVVDPAYWNAPTYGKVLLFVDRDTGSPPYMSFTTKTTSGLPVVLKELSGRFSPIEKRNSRIYVFEDEMWEVKGRFSQAVKDNAPLQWEMNDEGKMVLYLLAVGVFFFILSTFIT